MNTVDEMDRPIVVDLGSGMFKTGFAGRDGPRSIFPNIVGRAKSKSIQTMLGGMKDAFVGDDAQYKKALLNISSPMDRGHVTNWEDMERVFHHMFYNELRVSPEDQFILLSETCLNPRRNRRRMLEMMFEKFNVPSMMIMMDAYLSLISSSRVSGIILDCGDGSCSAVAFHNGCAMQQGMRKMNLGGKDLTDYLMKLLMMRKEHDDGYSDFDMKSSGSREIVRDIKEKLGRVCIGDSLLAGGDDEKMYELPDGNVVSVGKERFQCTEVLFDPSSSMIGLDSSCGMGIHEMVFDSIESCDEDFRKELYSNIVLSGGSTMFEGISERLHQEILKIMEQDGKEHHQLRISSPVERKYSVWIGASIVATLSSFQSMWITSKEYEEFGGAIVDRKSTN